MLLLTTVYNYLIIGAVLLQASPQAPSLTAEGILHKAAMLLNNAKTYQATFHWDEAWFRKDGTLSYSEHAIVESKTMGLTKFAVHEIFDKPSKQNDSPLTGTVDIVCNGVYADLYRSGKFEGSHRAQEYTEGINMNGMHGTIDMVIPQMLPSKGFKYILLASEKVNGKAAYVVQTTGDVERLNPPNSGEDRDFVGIDSEFYIDQATFQLLKKEVIRTYPRKKPRLTTKTTITFKSVVLNAPIPESTFNYKPTEEVTDGANKSK